MNQHAIMIIKNNKNEYLQYYDNRWNSYLFLNCKLSENFNKQDIIEEIMQKLRLSSIECRYLKDIVHKKYSESAKKEKEYHHYFFSIVIKDMPEEMKAKKFIKDDIRYSWYSFEELENDSRIQEVNSDIVRYVREFENY